MSYSLQVSENSVLPCHRWKNSTVRHHRHHLHERYFLGKWKKKTDKIEIYREHSQHWSFHSSCTTRQWWWWLLLLGAADLKYLLWCHSWIPWWWWWLLPHLQPRLPFCNQCKTRRWNLRNHFAALIRLLLQAMTTLPCAYIYFILF